MPGRNDYFGWHMIHAFLDIVRGSIFVLCFGWHSSVSSEFKFDEDFEPSESLPLYSECVSLVSSE